MSVERKLLRLSAEERAFLETERFLPQRLVQIIQSADHTDDGTCFIRVTSEVAEQFRSAFTDQLASVGFDADYALTREGEMLEGLIDRFFVGDAT